MIKQLFLILALALSQSLAFAPSSKNACAAKSALSLAVMPPPPTVTVTPQQLQQPMVSSSHQLQQGIQNYVSSMDSALPSMTVALQERKIPTPEEVAAKKRNFNFWFWGGGFVAPFLATFYYFGFKFWEK